MELVTHKALSFAHPRSAVWGAMADVESYQLWWPWLRTFEARALAVDELWRCTVRAPVGYTVSFTIAFTRVVEGSLAEARVSGDIRGGAELTLRDSAAGCDVVVRSDLAPESRFLRLLSRGIPALARYGHDWVLATGAQQFEHRALLSADARDTTT